MSLLQDAANFFKDVTSESFSESKDDLIQFGSEYIKRQAGILPAPVEIDKEEKLSIDRALSLDGSEDKKIKLLIGGALLLAAGVFVYKKLKKNKAA